MFFQIESQRAEYGTYSVLDVVQKSMYGLKTAPSSIFVPLGNPSVIISKQVANTLRLQIILKTLCLTRP